MSRMASFPRVVALVCGLAAAGSGAACAKARAAEAPAMPTLAPPEVPPRVVAEYEPDPPLPAAPVTTEALAVPSRPVRPPRRDTPRADPVDDAAPAPAIAAAAATPPPSLTLQTPGNAQADQSVRTLLARAARDLGRVDYATLDTDGKAQYDTARRFMQQADDALKTRNVMFAGKLADKAATMAAVLVR
jgi:hypothetical protein